MWLIPPIPPPAWPRAKSPAAGASATSAGSDQDLTTIAEMAAAAGLRSGIVSTASVTDATRPHLPRTSISACAKTPSHGGYHLPRYSTGRLLAGPQGQGRQGLHCRTTGGIRSCMSFWVAAASTFAPWPRAGKVSVAQWRSDNGFQLVTTRQNCRPQPSNSAYWACFREHHAGAAAR